MRKDKIGSSIVVLCGNEAAQEEGPLSTEERWTLLQLPDISGQNPNCSGLKNYWSKGTTICELQGVNRDLEFASFFVNGMVVPNGQLHTITPVDPLFFVIAMIGDEESSWKPLDQIFTDNLSDLTDSARKLLLKSIDMADSPTVRPPKSTLQYTHILELLELSDEEFVYKVSPTKVLSWLRRKQQAAECVLKQQESIEHLEVSNQTAFAEGFVMGGGNESMAETDKMVSKDKLSSAREESIQIVCQYLRPAWRDRFLNHLDISASDAFGHAPKEGSKKTKVAVASDWNTGLTQSAPDAITKDEESRKKPAITAGAKRLQKVSTKGMSKLSNFFQPKTKK